MTLHYITIHTYMHAYIHTYVHTYIHSVGYPYGLLAAYSGDVPECLPTIFAEEGVTTVLVSTNALEEGIDVADCTWVF